MVRRRSELDELTQWRLKQRGNGRPGQEVTDEVIAELRKMLGKPRLQEAWPAEVVWTAELRKAKCVRLGQQAVHLCGRIWDAAHKVDGKVLPSPLYRRVSPPHKGHTVCERGVPDF